MKSAYSSQDLHLTQQRDNLKVVLLYATFACTWIFLSDGLVGMLVSDRQLMALLSMFKGGLFVVVTALFLYLLLQRRSLLLHEVGAPFRGGVLTWRRRYIYLLSVAATLLSVWVSQVAFSSFVDHPILLVLMLPIMLSAFLGGLGPGLLSTLISVLGTATYSAYTVGGLLLQEQAVIPWAMMILDGVLISVMAELMRRSRMHSYYVSDERLQALKLLGSIAESSDDAIFAKDLDGRYQLFNQAASRLVGKPVEAVLGQDAYALFSRAQADEITATDARAIRENRTVTREERLVTVTGERYVRVTIGPLHDSLNRVIGVFGIARDLTRDSQHEVALGTQVDAIAEFRQACKEYDDERVMLMRAVNQLSAQFGKPMPFDLGSTEPAAKKESAR